MRASAAEERHFGAKTISFFGGIVLTVNNASGPGMLVLPKVFQQGGWLLCSALLIVMCIVSAFSATFLCDAIARVPGNSGLEQRIEFDSFAEVRPPQLAEDDPTRRYCVLLR